MYALKLRPLERNIRLTPETQVGLVSVFMPPVLDPNRRLTVVQGIQVRIAYFVYRIVYSVVKALFCGTLCTQ